MTVQEETPLLQHQHDVIYDRFTRRKKRIIVTLVAWSGLLPLLASGSFVPSIPQVAHDLNSTGPIVNLAVSLSIFANALGGLFWASYSTFYGRRTIYLRGLPILVVGSIGVALSPDIPQLMFWRFVQAFGAAGGTSVGSGVIGDIYKVEERGTAMGIFLASILLGAAIAPLAGGVAAHYASWRIMQLALGIFGVLGFVLMALFLPETTHPNSLGVDKMAESSETSQKKWVWVNPLSGLWLLRSPNVFAVALASTLVMLTHFVLLIPIAYTIGARYNITNEAVIGACFLPVGVGNFLGAPAAGWISDRTVVKWRKRRGGAWLPEDRLRATLFGAGLLVPVSVLFSGLTIQFIGGNVGLGLNFAFFFFQGFGVDMVLSPSAAYNVDILHSRSADIMAVNSGFRSFFIALATSGILPSINLIGVAYTNAIAALLAWIGFGLLWCTIRYGDRMRAWIDVGYSTAHDN